MTRLRLAALCACLVAAPACRIEDRTPTGTRRDEALLQALVAEYARTLSSRDWARFRSLFWPGAVLSGAVAPSLDAAPGQPMPVDSAVHALDRVLRAATPDEFDVRVLRSDLRQEGDVAAAWVTTRRRAPTPGGVAERDWLEHLVFTQVDGEWRISSGALARAPRVRPRPSADRAMLGAR